MHRVSDHGLPQTRTGIFADSTFYIYEIWMAQKIAKSLRKIINASKNPFLLLSISQHDRLSARIGKKCEHVEMPIIDSLPERNRFKVRISVQRKRE